jgi:hypothetical protein
MERPPNCTHWEEADPSCPVCQRAMSPMPCACCGETIAQVAQRAWVRVASTPVTEVWCPACIEQGRAPQNVWITTPIV